MKVLLAVSVLAISLTGCASMGKAMYGGWRDGLVEEVGLTTKTVEVEGETVAVYVRQGRDPVLVLHGFTSNKEGWLTVAKTLGDRGLIIPDLLGHGGTPPSDKPMTAAYQARIMAGVLDELKIETAHVVGMSMGGHIAGELALQRPDLARSVTFVSAVGWRGDREAEFDAALERGEASFDNPTREAVAAQWKWLIVADEPDFPGPVRTYLADERVARNEVVLRIFEDYAPTRFSLEGRLSEIQAPVSAIWCPADRMADISAAEELVALTGAPLTRLDGCAHLPQLEQPEATGRALVGFFETVESK